MSATEQRHPLMLPPEVEGRRYQHSTEPFDWIAAVGASRAAGEAQRNGERFLAQCIRNHATAEKVYREKLASEILRLRAEGLALTVAGDIARGDPVIAALAYDRNIAKGMVKAAEQGIWRHTADRRDLESLIDWSKRAAFLDAGERR